MNRVVITLLVLIVATGAAFAYVFRWEPQVKPALILPEAYNLATQALGSITNDFHCLGANCQVSGLGPNWNFSFSNTNGTLKTVFVYFDTKIKPQVLDSKDVSY